MWTEHGECKKKESSSQTPPSIPSASGPEPGLVVVLQQLIESVEEIRSFLSSTVPYWPFFFSKSPSRSLPYLNLLLLITHPPFLKLRLSLPLPRTHLSSRDN